MWDLNIKILVRGSIHVKSNFKIHQVVLMAVTAFCWTRRWPLATVSGKKTWELRSMPCIAPKTSPTGKPLLGEMTITGVAGGVLNHMQRPQEAARMIRASCFISLSYMGFVLNLYGGFIYG